MQDSVSPMKSNRMADEETKTNRSNKSSNRSGGEHEDSVPNAPRLECVTRNEDDIEHRQQLNERKKLFV
jgi:hypothetical protein